jgi:hypothetical protein
MKLSQPASQLTTTKEMWKILSKSLQRASLQGATGGCIRAIHGALAKMSSIGCCVLFTARPAATPQCQSSCQIAATLLVGQQIQRPAPSAALLAVATCEADCVLHVAYI